MCSACSPALCRRDMDVVAAIGHAFWMAFTEPITVYRGPYDYSVRGAAQDFCAQYEVVVPA